MMPTVTIRRVAALLAVLLGSAGCDAALAPAATTPTATIATVQLVQASPPPARPGPAPAAPAPVLTPTPTLPPALSVTTPTAAELASPFTYLWPGYLPAGMQLLPQESRVAQANEAGVDDLGFYIITFGAGQQKVVLGGGSVEAFELSGAQQQIMVNDQAAVLTSSDQQLQIEFRQLHGQQFVYGYAISQEELLQVAGALTPIPVADLRQRVAAPGQS